jgi:hypothetical protein
MVEFDEQVRREFDNGQRKMRNISIRLDTVAIAPERSMSAKVRSIAIRPGRDSPTMGTKIVISTRNARKKLRCRSSRQKPGNRRSISAT